jgi:hypothetical protein
MERRALERYAPLTGLAFFILAFVSFILSNDSPDSDDGPVKVISYWSSHDSKEIASAIVATFAVLFLVWFMASVRSAILRVEGGSGRLATLTFAGGVIAATALVVSNAFEFATAESVGDVPPTVTQTLSVIYADFWFPIVLGFGLMMLAAGLAGIRYGWLPAWAAWVTIVLGVLSFTPIGFFALLATIIWIGVVSIVLFLGESRAAPTAPAAPEPAGRVPPPGVPSM